MLLSETGGREHSRSMQKVKVGSISELGNLNSHSGMEKRGESHLEGSTSGNVESRWLMDIDSMEIRYKQQQILEHIMSERERRIDWGQQRGNRQPELEGDCGYNQILTSLVGESCSSQQLVVEQTISEFDFWQLEKNQYTKSTIANHRYVNHNIYIYIYYIYRALNPQGVHNTEGPSRLRGEGLRVGTLAEIMSLAFE